jgi:hypothetical protein
MRNLGLVVSLISYGCGSSTVSRDSASPIDVGGPDSPLAVDTGIQTGPPSYDLATEGALCGLWTGNPYNVDLSADAGGCEGRPTIPCSGVDGSEASLDSQMMNLVGSCGALMGESAINVSFTQGCADHVYWETSYYDPTPILACLANVLGASRFACAEEVSCWGWGNSTLM